MFGLGDEWLLSGKKGGGIIIVCPSAESHNPDGVGVEAKMIGISFYHLFDSSYRSKRTDIKAPREISRK